MSIRYRLLVMPGAALLFGCVSATQPGMGSPEPVMGMDQSTLQLRSYQERAFDTADKEQALRSVIATLQDLSFVLDETDFDLGTVSATKLHGYQLHITVTVQTRGSSQTIVRANLQKEGRSNVKEDPKPYQDFFIALEKEMFLTAHDVD
jgi:hypothetical protein